MGKKFRATIGDRIRDVRGNMTQERFAKRLGVKQNYVCRYEKGRFPSPELLLKIARFGNVSID
ncbi:MAG TPA: helix-turn-helix transcriptional regulator [Nitrospiria bacterium]|jgi:transcriptional regulator with XRE-family HTH domain